MTQVTPKKVSLTSSDTLAQRQETLHAVFPEVFSENKIDWDRLQAVLGESVDFGREKFGFTWKGKGEAIKSVLIPSKATLVPVEKESVDFDKTENIFIEGDNLEVLKLLQKTYFEQVKVIYIDPPYNTGGDFVYRDNFAVPLQNYLEQTGQKDSEGNSLQTNRESSGRYHSDWLSMMYPRLKLAWNLLREDGFIFVSIDDNEVHHLKMLMNEIFGEENFRNTIFVARVKKNIQERDQVKALNQGVGYLLCYSKSSAGSIIPPTKFQQKDERWHAFDAPGVRPTMEYDLLGVKPPKGRHWMYEQIRALEMVAAGDLRLSPNTNKPQYRLAASDQTNLDTDWTDLIESDSTWIKNGGKNPKLIQRILQMVNDKNALVLDFFSGSGTTGEAVIKQNADDTGYRNYVLVQLPEKIDPKEESKYSTISELTKARLKQTASDKGFKIFKLAASNYIENNFDFDPEKSEEENTKAFEEYLSKAKQGTLFEKAVSADVVYENIIKEGFSLNSKIEKVQIGGNNFYQVTDGEKQLFICLESKVDSSTVKKLSAGEFKEKTVIAMDDALSDSDKANLALALELKTI